MKKKIVNRLDKLEGLLSTFMFQIEKIMSTQMNEVNAAVINISKKKIDQLYLHLNINNNG